MVLVNKVGANDIDLLDLDFPPRFLTPMCLVTRIKIPLVRIENFFPAGSSSLLR